MRVSAICLPLSAAIALAITLTGAPASAKTLAECNREYAADKAAIKASGQTKKDYVAACRSGASPPAATAPSPEPTPTPKTGY